MLLFVFLFQPRLHETIQSQSLKAFAQNATFTTTETAVVPSVVPASESTSWLLNLCVLAAVLLHLLC